MTQSLKVACSFAQDSNEEFGYIYVFGLPYYTNRISHNSEHDLVNIRLLSICPPNAMRPYFQEGYMVGTEDILFDYKDKNELDFNRRLIAKFKIENKSEFWLDYQDKIPRNALYPDYDIIETICNKIKDNLTIELTDQDIGRFLKEWTKIEEYLINRAQKYKQNIYSLRGALLVLKNNQDEKYIKEIDNIRLFRNTLVHNPSKINKDLINQYTSILANILNNIN